MTGFRTNGPIPEVLTRYMSDSCKTCYKVLFHNTQVILGQVPLSWRALSIHRSYIAVVILTFKMKVIENFLGVKSKTYYNFLFSRLLLHPIIVNYDALSIQDLTALYRLILSIFKVIKIQFKCKI